MNRLGPLPAATGDKALVLARLLLNPWVISCVAAGFLALISCMAAFTRFALTYAYPFVSVTFAIVLIPGAFFLVVELIVTKVAGASIMVICVIIGSRD